MITLTLPRRLRGAGPSLSRRGREGAPKAREGEGDHRSKENDR
jgi:hypothetical protein